jgi:hypothetical protein
LRSLQPDGHVQLLAKVIDNAIDLFLGHAQPPAYRCLLGLSLSWSWTAHSHKF